MSPNFRVLAPLLVAGATWLVPWAASACICGDFVALPDFARAGPANAMVLAGHCGPELPATFTVTVDGASASMEPEDVYLGPHMAAWRVEPTPAPGQRVAIEACLDSEYTRTQDLDYTTEALDSTPPQAAGTVAVQRDVMVGLEIDCPSVPLVQVRVNLQQRDDTVLVRAEVVNDDDVGANANTVGPEGMVWLNVLVDDPTRSDCVNVFALDAAGNETAIQTECEAPEIAEVPLDRGCGCRNRPGSPGALAWLVLLTGLAARGTRSRRARRPRPDPR